MSLLPDELWRRILEIGVENSGLSYKDLCCVSISCRRLNRLSSEDSLWNLLLSSNFTPSFSSSKSLFKYRFERDKERKLASHRRAVFRKESQIMEHSRRLRHIQSQIAQETAKATQTSLELSNLRRVRQASVALNVWQPEVVRGRQKQMVEQCAVPAESRIQTLEMELRLCRQQILGLEKSYKNEKCRLITANEELASMNYHPVREYKRVSRQENEQTIIHRKKLKRCNSIQEQQCKTP